MSAQMLSDVEPVMLVLKVKYLQRGQQNITYSFRLGTTQCMSSACVAGFMSECRPVLA